MSDIHQRLFTLYLMKLDGIPLEPSQQEEMQVHFAACPECQSNRRLYQGLRFQAARRWPVTAVPVQHEATLRKMQERPSLNRAAFPLRAAIWIVFAVVALIIIQWMVASSRPTPAVQPPVSPTSTPTSIPTPTLQEFITPATQIDTFSLLSADHRREYDYFGASVDIDGDVLVAGAPLWNSPGVAAGDAYVFRKSAQGEWQWEATLNASDRDDGFQRDQHFGEAVAIQGNVIAVGAPGTDDPQAGQNIVAVYIYEYDGNGWVQTARLMPNLKLPKAKIGRSIAFDGEYLAASGSADAQSVAIFQRQPGGWREMPPIFISASPDGKPVYALLDLYGDTLAISTIPWAELKEPVDEASQQAWAQSLRTAGVVTLYGRSGDGWAQVFQTGPQEASLYFMRPDIPSGLPIALGGEAGEARWLAIGKPGFPYSGRESGSVALYQQGEDGWQFDQELALAPGNEALGSFAQFPALSQFIENPAATCFGAYVKMEGNRLAVISTFANAAYVFDRKGQNWEYQFRVTPGADYMDDFQRRTVALNNNTLLLSSPGELGGGNIFVFKLAEEH